MTVDSFNFIAGKRKSSSIRITNNLERKPDLSEGRYLINIKDRTLADIEKEVIYKALDETNNNKTEAAKKLGVTARTLRNKLKIYEEE